MHLRMMKSWPLCILAYITNRRIYTEAISGIFQKSQNGLLVSFLLLLICHLSPSILLVFFTFLIVTEK